jgi:hypothetical protein
MPVLVGVMQSYPPKVYVAALWDIHHQWNAGPSGFFPEPVRQWLVQQQVGEVHADQ